jgi:hypothetical protein
MHVRSLVGYTSSNKPIYQFDRANHAELSHLFSNFNDEDTFDVMTVFSYLQLFYWRRYGAHSTEYQNGQFMLEFCETRISAAYIDQRKRALGLATAFDLSDYGREHCVSYLQDLIGS